MEVDKDEDELEDIASGLDEVIQECVKECQEMLGSTPLCIRGREEGEDELVELGGGKGTPLPVPFLLLPF
eukprot:scaffold5484_cov105-Skeletonema_menzelii.AAC.1